jgi:hypothetical protein
VVDDDDLLVKPAVHLAMAIDRDVGVDVDGAGRQRQEELNLVIGEIIHRQELRAHAVEGEDEAREKARVVDEEPVVLRRRRLEIPAAVTDDEGAAVENAYRVGHA